MQHKSRQKLNKILLIIGILVIASLFFYCLFEFNKFMSEGTREVIKFCCNQLKGQIIDGDCIKNNLTVDFGDCKIPSIHK
jgi:hypothetical protein